MNNSPLKKTIPLVFNNKNFQVNGNRGKKVSRNPK